MTIEEARAIYGDKTNTDYVTCARCPINGCENEVKYCPNGCDGRGKAHRAIAKYITDQGLGITDPNDIINHPSHYCREGGMESIEEMVLVFGKEAVKNFCLCNVWKYRYRSSSKNGDEDLKKSDWYMKKFKELSNE